MVQAHRSRSQAYFFWLPVLVFLVGLAFNAALYRLGASSVQERQQFREYVDRQSLSVRYPGIQGLGFARAIRPDELDAHVAEVRSEGFYHYNITPSGQRDLYSAIVFLEPFSGRNLRAFGFDMYSEPVRNAAMRRSVDTGDMALTGRVRLQQESGHVCC